MVGHGVEDGVGHPTREQAVHHLVGAVVLDLGHDGLVATDAVGHAVGKMELVFVAHLGAEEVVKLVDDLGEELVAAHEALEVLAEQVQLVATGVGFLQLLLGTVQPGLVAVALGFGPGCLPGPDLLLRGRVTRGVALLRGLAEVAELAGRRLRVEERAKFSTSSQWAGPGALGSISSAAQRLRPTWSWW